MTVRNEERVPYKRDEKAAPAKDDETLRDDAIIASALAVLTKRIKKVGAFLTSPGAVRDYLRLTLQAEHELFACVWLDSQNRVIDCDVMFRGTLMSTSVHPREVVKAGLRHNAASVVVAHNHPSGIARPSEPDLQITQNLAAVLEVVDIRLLDHFIVAGDKYFSFTEAGLL